MARPNNKKKFASMAYPDTTISGSVGKFVYAVTVAEGIILSLFMSNEQ